MPFKKRVKSLVFLLFFAVSGVFGQGRGAILDEEAYNSLPRTASLAASSYKGLPSSYSLRQYAPLAGDQEDYGTCVGWAAAYGARTISESIALNRLNQTETTQNAFSPYYVYRSIRPDDPHGLYGAQIYTALDLMRDTGAVKMLDIERTLSFTNMDLRYFKNSRYYPIGDYLTLFSRDDRQKPALIPRIIKKSLSEGKPVIIGMNTPDSFIDAAEVWRPASNENPEYHYGGHALCVVGYDDNRYGGAFEVLNSWGRKWGNGGYIWIPYQTFVEYVNEGYVIIENIATFSGSNSFSGFVQMEVHGAQAENVQFELTQEGIFKTSKTYTGGTKYQINVGSRESAYVYVISVSGNAADTSFYSPVLLFPQAGVSPLLNYTDSVITLPKEDMTFTVNSNAGTEYIITLYAKQPLDIHSVMRNFEAGRGSLSKKLSAGVGDYLMTAVSFSENEAGFTASPDNPRTVTALIIAIEHR